MKKDGSVDLSQGVVAQLLGKSGKVNGGSVSWNMEDYSLAYVDGTLPIRNNVYVMANGTVSLSVTTADDVLSVLVLEVLHRQHTKMPPDYPASNIVFQSSLTDNYE